jgi:hypothetical protein
MLACVCVLAYTHTHTWVLLNLRSNHRSVTGQFDDDFTNIMPLEVNPYIILLVRKLSSV